MFIRSMVSRILPVMLISLLACDYGHEGYHVRRDDAQNIISCHHSNYTLPAAPAGQGSVHDLPALFLNRRGDTVAIRSKSGAPTIVSMVYADCIYNCPGLLGQLKTMLDQYINPGQRSRVQPHVYLVSLDRRNTPEGLRAFGQRNDLPEETFSLLVGNEASIAALAGWIGVRYRQVTRRHFAHTNVIAVLDTSGNIVNRTTSLSSAPGPGMLLNLHDTLK